MPITRRFDSSGNHADGRGFIAGAAAVSTLGAAGVWALRPLPPIDPKSETRLQSPPGARAETRRSAEVTPQAFSVPIWIAPPAPPSPPVPPPPAPVRPALKLQLLAIIREGGVDRAILYDPDLDRLFSRVAGETLGDRTVRLVTSERVDITDGDVVRTLALRNDGGAK